MTDSALQLLLGGLSRAELRERLAAAGVQLNVHAETLLDHPCFDERAPETVMVTQRRVADLGLPEEGTLPEVIAASLRQGLALCPATTGPYLRLAMASQSQAPDSLLSAGRIPTGALHVVSEPLSADHEFPKGFYLRVVEGVSWLRGFRCDDDYVWPPESVIALRAADGD
ncbi:hypothetical protein GCM10023160_01330 [Brachybacterium paraconglomeratum]|uniref:hypothetical protein n=1 Tax=Brachybacterium paraconglomeratum TaxID=173362 RepID=UPI0031EF4F4D